MPLPGSYQIGFVQQENTLYYDTGESRSSRDITSLALLYFKGDTMATQREVVKDLKLNVFDRGHWLAYPTEEFMECWNNNDPNNELKYTRDDLKSVGIFFIETQLTPIVRIFQHKWNSNTNR